MYGLPGPLSRRDSALREKSSSRLAVGNGMILPMAKIQTIGIIGKRSDADKVGPTIRRLVDYLHRHDLQVLFDEQSARMITGHGNQGFDLDTLGQRCDLAIVVGGDGTLLHAARAMAAMGVPLIGINLGRLGFLVDVSPQTIETSMEQILAGEFEAEERCMLAVHAAGEPNAALNDVVIHKWNTARMIEFETYIDGIFVNAQRSDGLIIATPTGSTAYALSGGGPLLHPTLDALVLVPICPHDLSNRPLVVTGDSRIEIRVCRVEHEHVRISYDGMTDLDPMPGGSIFVEKHPHRVRLLHPPGHDHYKILRAKLGWGGHPNANRSC